MSCCLRWLTRSSVLLPARKRCLLVVGRLSSVRMMASTLIGRQPLAGEIGHRVLAADGEQAHLAAHPRGVAGDDAGAADEQFAQHRGDDDGRIFLRHAERIAGDVFVDDQIADHQHLQRREFRQHGLEISDTEAMAPRIVERLEDRRRIELAELAPDQIERGERHFARREQQPPTVAIQHRLLGIVGALVLLALDHHRGLQRGDDVLGLVAQQERVIDEADRVDAFEPQIVRQHPVVARIGDDADDENVAAFGGEFQQPQMAGMDDVEIAGDEHDRAVRPGLGPDLLQHRFGLGVQHGQPSVGSISISGRTLRRCSRSSSATLISSSA